MQRCREGHPESTRKTQKRRRVQRDPQQLVRCLFCVAGSVAAIGIPEELVSSMEDTFSAVAQVAVLAGAGTALSSLCLALSVRGVTHKVRGTGVAQLQPLTPPPPSKGPRCLEGP